MVQPTETAEPGRFRPGSESGAARLSEAAHAVVADLPGVPRLSRADQRAYACPPTQLALAQQLGIDRSVRRTYSMIWRVRD